MSNSIYFGTYARFDTASKRDGSNLMGADNLVGDIFSIEFVTENGERIAWLKNRWGARVGFFNSTISHELSLYEAREWKLTALLAYVAYSDSPEPGVYWGEAAIVCYDPRKEAFDSFVSSLSSRLADGNRPEINLGEQGIAQVISSKGEWMPRKLLSQPKLDQGTVMMKARRSASEKLIEQGRMRNKGCYVGSALVYVLVIVAVVFALRACGVF